MAEARHVTRHFDFGDVNYSSRVMEPSVRVERVGGAWHIKQVVMQEVGAVEAIGTPSTSPLGPDDPLLWFGRLHPPGLKKFQAEFKSALQKVVEVSNIHSVMIEIEQEYLLLKKQKEIKVSL